MVSIDLVVCTHDNAAMLDRALDAMARLRVPADADWGILVVDDRCTDSTRVVVERHRAAGRLPIRSVEEPVPGQTASRARGVRNTTPDSVAFVDDDNLLLTANWLEQAARFVAEHPTCGGFGSRVVLACGSPPPPWAERFRWVYAGAKRGDSPARRRSLAGRSPVPERHALLGCAARPRGGP